MNTAAWLSVAVVVAIIVLPAANVVAVETALLGGLVTLLLFGAVDLQAGLAGFAHPAVLMIGALFVVAAGLTETGATNRMAQSLLGRPKSVMAAQFRLMGPVALLSAFLNNTPIVVMYLPIVNDWARKIRVSPSKLYMPLSFAAVLGGKLTLIGSASNLVVMGLYQEYARDTPGLEPLSPNLYFWGPGLLGIPTVIIGIAFILLTSKWLLPERKPAEQQAVDTRRYTVQMEIRPDSPIVAKSIEAAGLRQLPGLYLTQIERGDEQMPAPPPETILRAGDILAFAGILESVVDLRKIRGLIPATDQIEKVSSAANERALVEAVISHNSPLIGRTVKQTRFRTTYNAAIIAVHRNGGQVRRKVGDIEIHAGDTLLLETHRDFVDGYRNSGDFYLVSNVAGSNRVRHEKASTALGIFVLLVAALAYGSVPPVVLGLAAALAMILTGCLTVGEARGSVSIQVIVVIASALGIGAAMASSGAALVIADELLGFARALGMGPRGILLAIFMLTTALAQALTNNGAAALMFPIAMAAAAELGLRPEPFAFTLLLGAGTSFLTPIGYQTNLLVYGPGGYRFLDFTRIGLPLSILLALMAAWLAPIAFPF
ncbi:MAG: SLC13 family permease [Acidobacteria bacterium]|nr:SLC13 family permease [Acidobacteriota bacterium]MDA1233517.1 SLC13 family permease [Acidobacteriota bacterium]